MSLLAACGHQLNVLLAESALPAEVQTLLVRRVTTLVGRTLAYEPLAVAVRLLPLAQPTAEVLVTFASQRKLEVQVSYQPPLGNKRKLPTDTLVTSYKHDTIVRCRSMTYNRTPQVVESTLRNLGLICARHAK